MDFLLLSAGWPSPKERDCHANLWFARNDIFLLDALSLTD